MSHFGRHFPRSTFALLADFTYEVDELHVDFTDASSSAAEIVSWSWDFGDGTSSSDQNPAHDYASAGEYSVALTVEDDSGQMNSVVHTVTMVPAILGWQRTFPGGGPSARFGAQSCHFPGVGIIVVSGTINGNNGIADDSDGTHAAAWILSGGAWTKTNPGVLRKGHTGFLAYDPSVNKALYMPSYDAGYLYEWAEFNGTTWTAYSVGGAPPSFPRGYSHRATYNVGAIAGSSSRIMLVQPYNDGVATFGTFGYNWSTHDFGNYNVDPPAIGYEPVMGYDPITKQPILIGGSSGWSANTYSNITSEWVAMPVPTTPTGPSSGCSGCNHPLRGTFILKTARETWEWDGVAWSLLLADDLDFVNVGDFQLDQTVYDPVSKQVVVMFGRHPHNSGSTSGNAEVLRSKSE